MKKLFILLGLLLTFSLSGQNIFPGIVASSGVAGIPPVTSPYTKTWSTWDNTVVGENLVDGGVSSGIVYSKGDDVSAKFYFTGTTVKTEVGLVALANETWESWGVPAGKTVTQVELLTLNKKVVSGANLTGLTYHMDIVTTGGTIIHSAGSLTLTITDDRSIDATYQVITPAVGARSVGATYQASATPVRLQITCVMTQTSGTADFRIDDVVLRITFN